MKRNMNWWRNVLKKTKNVTTRYGNRPNKKNNRTNAGKNARKNHLSFSSICSVIFL